MKKGLKMNIDSDFMETGDVVHLGDNWYMDTVTREKKYLTEEGDLITEKEYEESDGGTFYDDADGYDV